MFSIDSLGQWALVLGFFGTGYWLVWSYKTLTPEQRRTHKTDVYVTTLIIGVATALSVVALIKHG